jgi:hypothetical protein
VVSDLESIILSDSIFLIIPFQFALSETVVQDCFTCHDVIKQGIGYFVMSGFQLLRVIY